MPDFGLTEALEQALKASKGASVMRPAEAELAARAAKAAPAPAAPAVPPASAAAPSAIPAPGAVQAPALNPSVPPPDIPAPTPEAAAVSTDAAPAPAPVAAGATDAAPPSAVPGGSAAVTEAPPLSRQPAPEPAEVAPANKLPPAPAAPTPMQASAQRFVTANIGDFADKLNMSHMPNVDTIVAPDGLKAAVLKVADDNEGVIQTARGGVIGDQQLTAIAQDLAVNKDVVQQALTREFGGAQVTRPAVALAARMVELNEFGKFVQMSDAVAAGRETSEQGIQWEQQKQLVEQWLSQVMGMKAQSGRVQRVLGLPVGLDPAVADHVASVLKQNNPDRQAMAQAIQLAGTPSGVANIVQGSLAYRALVKAPFNLLQRIFINGILSGPPTWAKIIVGNNANLALNSFDLYAAGIGRQMYGLAARLGGFPTAEEGVQLSDAYAHMHGVISGGADALRIAGRMIKTGENIEGHGLSRANETANGAGQHTLRGIVPELDNNSYFGAIAKSIDTIVDIPGSRIIGPIDQFTQTLGYRGYVTMMALKDVRARLATGTLKPGDAEAAMLDMMKNTSPEIQQAATAWGARMTFQSPFPPGGPGQAFQDVLNKAPALRFVFPFMRTATNIFKQGLGERTPLGLFSARIRAQLANGGFEGDLAKSRMATGTAIGGMLAWMAVHDRITGDAPKDPKERGEWELDGRTPNSIRITDPITGKDTWRSYQWFEPMATIASAVSNIVSLQAYIHRDNDVDSMLPHDNWANEAAANIMASVITNVGNKTFMQGAAQFSEMYTDPKRAFQMWANETAASMVPYSGATKFVRNMQDPYMRQAFTLIDKIKDQLPTQRDVGLNGSKTLVPRLDVFGETRMHNGGNSILGPLNPLPGSPVKKDDVTDELQSVMEQTRTVPITLPSKQLALLGSGKGLQDGTGMRLTPSEYYDYVTMSRKDPIFDGGTATFRDKLAQRIASPMYQEASPAERGEFLKAIQHQADKIGAARLFKENDDFRERMINWTAEANRLKYSK